MCWKVFPYMDVALWEDIDCWERNCTVWAGYDPSRPHWRFFRHGDQPEAVLEVPSPEPIPYSHRSLLDRVTAWVAQVHRYEDARSSVQR
jgi:hypothetical protein